MRDEAHHQTSLRAWLPPPRTTESARTPPHTPAYTTSAHAFLAGVRAGKKDARF
jgi:hypothetical protein